MQFNAEKTEEVIFSTKRLRPQHPSLKLGNDEIAIVPEQRRKNTANLQTWFGGRFWPKIEEGFVLKDKILYCWHSSCKCGKKSSINT